MESLYRKVYIKTEADLPEEGEYVCQLKNGSLINCDFDTDNQYGALFKKWYSKNIDWYLQPLPEPAQKKTFSPQSTQIGNEPQYITNARNKQRAKLAAGLFIGAKNMKPEGKTAEIILEDITHYKEIAKMNENQKTIHVVTIKDCLLAMEEYRKQGRYYTEDEIRIIQEQAYDEGLKVDKSEL